jgi:hypothetical protein
VPALCQSRLGQAKHPSVDRKERGDEGIDGDDRRSVSFSGDAMIPMVIASPPGR